MITINHLYDRYCALFDPDPPLWTRREFRARADTRGCAYDALTDRDLLDAYDRSCWAARSSIEALPCRGVAHWSSMAHVS